MFLKMVKIEKRWQNVVSYEMHHYALKDKNFPDTYYA